MIQDRLFDIAFQYKKTKLWKRLNEYQMFAVRMTDGTIGYIQILGGIGDYCAVALYLGDEGLQSYFRILEQDATTASEDFFYHSELVVSQSCLQLVFGIKDDLTDDQLEAVQTYAKKKGIRFAGKNAYPHFMKFEPAHLPWPMGDDQDQEYMYQAMEAVMKLTSILRNQSPAQIGLTPWPKGNGKFHLFELRPNGYEIVGFRDIPEAKAAEYPTATSLNEIGIRKISKFKTKHPFQAQVVMMPNPCMTEEISEDMQEPDSAPVFPYVLLMVEEKTNYLMPIEPVLNYNDSVNDLVNQLISTLIEHEVRPTRIKVRDDRTKALLLDFASKLKISVKTEEELPELYDALANLYDFCMDENDEMFDDWDDDDLDEDWDDDDWDDEDFDDDSDESEYEEKMAIVCTILEMDAQQLKKMPLSLKNDIKAMIEDMDLPKEIKALIRKKLGK